MNWLAFTLLLWVSLGLELGFRGVFLAGSNTSAPSFVVPVIVFVALRASTRSAVWAALIAGVLLDLSWKIDRAGGGAANIIGPYALGLVLATQAVLAARGSVMRRHPVTLAVLSSAVAIICHLVVVTIISLRGLYDGVEAWQPAGELWSRFIGAIYTAGAALIMAFVLNPAEPLLGLHTDRRRRF